MKKMGRRWEPYLFLLPAFVFMVMFIYFPFAKNGWLSLNIVNQFRELKSFAGLRNYGRVLSDPGFLQAVGNTFVYVLVTVPLSIGIAYILANLARKRRPLSVVYEVLFALSMATSDSVIAMIFQLGYNLQLGIVNQLFGVSIDWLNDSNYALKSLMFIQIWHNVGYNFLFILAALRSMPEDVLESAELDGVTGLRKHTKIILPLASSMLFFLLVKDVAYGMTVCNYSLILTKGGPNGATQTIITYIYSKAITSTNYNYAFSATMLGFLISAALISLSMLLEKKKVFYQ